MEEKFDITSVDRAEELVSSITDPEQREQAFYKCANSILNKKLNEVSGSASSFHNFAVTCVKTSKDYLTAFEIVKLGLAFHNADTDLLADAIKYGYNCSALQDCTKYYNCLKNISKKRWSWRAFSFSIDYLTEICNSDSVNNESIEKEIASLAKDYRENLASEKPDDSLYTQFEVEYRFGDKSNALCLLKGSLEAKEPHPKCWLRYADILADHGDYKSAAKPIIKLLNYPEASESVNISYVHYLKAVCQFAVMNQVDSDDLFAAIEYDPSKVNMIYDSLTCAIKSSDLYGTLRIKIRKMVEELQNRAYKIQAPYELQELISRDT